MYRVFKKDYTKREIVEDYGKMNIDELKEFAKKFINIYFENENELEEEIEFIKRNKFDCWWNEKNKEVIRIMEE